VSIIIVIIIYYGELNCKYYGKVMNVIISKNGGKNGGKKKGSKFNVYIVK